MATTTFIRTIHKQCGSTTASVQRVLYIAREGQYAPLDYITGARNPQGRDDLIYTESVNLPAWAQGSAARFFAVAAERERANGIVSTEWKFALPRELSRAQQLAAARDVLTVELGTTHPYVWAMHEPHASDSAPNPHVHAIFSSRTLDGIERSPEQFFRRYNPDHPERGGAPKNGKLHAFGVVKDQRRAYTDVMNLSLEHAGSRARLHPDRLSTRGFDRDPEPRAWPSDSYDLKHNQKVTTRWQAVLDHRQRHQGHHAIERDNAYAYWEGRKARLGITEHTPYALALERIAEAYQYALTHPPHQRSQRALEHEGLSIQHEIATATQDLAWLVAEQIREDRRQPHRAVALEAQRLRGAREGEGQGVGFRVSLEEERSQGGYSR